MTKVSYICPCGRRFTKNELSDARKEQERRDLARFILKNDLIKDRIFTRAQIAYFVREKILVAKMYQGHSYFDHLDVVRAVQKLSPPKGLFSQ